MSIMLFISFELTTVHRKRLAIKKYVKFSMCLEILIDKKIVQELEMLL